MTNLMNLTPELIGALNKLHQDHHQELLKIKEHLTKMVVEKQNGKGYEHHFIATSDLLDIVNPVIAICGLSLNSMLQGDDLVTVLSHGSGGYFISRTYISQIREGKDIDAIQWRMSRATITRRTQVLGLLNLDDGSPDDDGNVADRNYHGSSKSEIIDQKGAEVVENVKETIKKMGLETVKAKKA